MVPIDPHPRRWGKLNIEPLTVELFQNPSSLSAHLHVSLVGAPNTKWNPVEVMRCELSTAGDIPCRRCQRLKRECTVDTEYKRVNKHEKLEELEQEIRKLRSSITTAPDSHAKSQPMDGIDLPVNDFPVCQGTSALSPETSVMSNEFPPAVPAIPFAEKLEFPKQTTHSTLSSKNISRSIDGITLDASQIDSCFRLFFERYHPYIPFLDPYLSSEDYYSKSPLLFWVIVYVSSRRGASEPGIEVRLTCSVKKLLWECISNPPHPWELVQAIILVCMWPFPTSSLSTDNTVVLVTTAQTMALRLGLHRPDVIRDFSRTDRRLSQGETTESLKTWAACFIAIQSVVFTDGLPLISCDYMIDKICDNGSAGLIPEPLRVQLVMSRFAARVCTVMATSAKSPANGKTSGENLSLLALLEQDFIDMTENSIMLDGNGLHLYVFFLLEPSGSDVRRRALLRAFNTATALISKVQDLDSRYGTMEYGPVAIFRSLALAASFILKIGFSSYAPYLDFENGKQLFSTATHFMRRISTEDNDLPGRMSKIMTQLWSAHTRIDRSNEEPSLRLKTRLSGSLLHDFLWSWRETFGGQGDSAIDAQHGSLGPSENVMHPENEGFDIPLELGGDILQFDYMLDSEFLSLLPYSFDGDVSVTE
ncbi:Putative transcription factor SEF1 [Talaromyces islandicus]|uniref:Putative transcription factor SEF1 n=1 Tax=Talaromyces islandicus TaxID=28573 RepID=A0A0U1LWM4_TALIS|nr:Putative transcription factor SEF1 [Talaromyces islandicus]